MNSYINIFSPQNVCDHVLYKAPKILYKKGAFAKKGK